MRKYLFGDNYGRGGTIETNLGVPVLQNSWISILHSEPRTRNRKGIDTNKDVRYHVFYVKTKDSLVVVGTVPNKENLERIYSSSLKGQIKVNPILDGKLEEKIKRRILNKEELYDDLLILDWSNICKTQDTKTPKPIQRYRNIETFSNF